jgi:hypothetical protein
MAAPARDFSFYIDRGGTFTDVVAAVPDAGAPGGVRFRVMKARCFLSHVRRGTTLVVAPSCAAALRDASLGAALRDARASVCDVSPRREPATRCAVGSSAPRLQATLC